MPEIRGAMIERSERNIRLTIIVLAILHLVGTAGLSLEFSRPAFQALVPYNLLLSVGLLFLFHRQWSTSFLLLVFGIFWAGYFVEVIGVQTGAIFGEYAYGPVLGFSVAGVPPVIGLNWVMLAYCSGMIVNRQLDWPVWQKAIAAAFLMVLLDVVIEPSAIELNFWTWEGGSIPIRNYVGWFLISLVMQVAFFLEKTPKDNPLALPLYLIQFLFFVTLWVVRL